MRRLLPAALGALAALTAVTALPAAAQAHPLGNFSLNHLAVVSVTGERLEVRYVLDEAEIPTFQQRDLAPASVLARKRAEVARRLALTVDGRRTALVLDGPGLLRHRPGQGGLPTTRVVLHLHAAIAARGTAVLHDGTYPGRVGWKAVVPVAGRGTAVRSSVTGDDPTRRLTVYPKALLTTPADVRTAVLAFAPGAGTLTAPRSSSGAVTADRSGGTAGFAALFDEAAAGRGVLVFLLVAAFGWGALHALSPGHGKTMVAAYLIGTRGRARDALALGATVTAAHTIGVFALGLVTLALSAYVLPEDLYPWLNLVSGLLVLAVGVVVLRARSRAALAHHHDRYHRGPARRAGPDDGCQADVRDRHHGHGAGHDDAHHADAHHHHHDHHHGHGAGPGGTHHADAHDHGHHHGRAHDHDHGRTRRTILAMGASAGMIPCPTALVVLLGAIAQHEIVLGLVLIVAFSAGLAATLTTIGVLVVKATRLPAPGRLAAVVPAVSSLAIVVVGFVLTARAVPPLVG